MTAPDLQREADNVVRNAALDDIAEQIVRQGWFEAQGESMEDLLRAINGFWDVLESKCIAVAKERTEVKK